MIPPIALIRIRRNVTDGRTRYRIAITLYRRTVALAKHRVKNVAKSIFGLTKIIRQYVAVSDR